MTEVIKDSVEQQNKKIEYSIFSSNNDPKIIDIASRIGRLSRLCFPYEIGDETPVVQLNSSKNNTVLIAELSSKIKISLPNEMKVQAVIATGNGITKNFGGYLP